MATFETNPSAASTFAGRVSSFFVSVVGAVAAWNDARLTRNALSKLSARELDDIGLCYSDIDAIAARGAR
ncbi:DUF1127 domain-containing protein [Yoonia sp. 67]|uniref:DUF1127 domain-containing protein n=1 Tax=unclassified Yoonia TaxID=2629118 RepID=UPI003A4C7503